MSIHPHTPARDIVPTAEFAPVPVQHRHDGWTPERQIAFIEALAETGCVEEAARSVGMTARSAYRLRLHPHAGASFRYAWEAALTHAVARLEPALIGRALNGVATPVFYRGQQVGERRTYDNRLAQFVLALRGGHRHRRINDPADSPVEFPAILNRICDHGGSEAADVSGPDVSRLSRLSGS